MTHIILVLRFVNILSVVRHLFVMMTGLSIWRACILALTVSDYVLIGSLGLNDLGFLFAYETTKVQVSYMP